MSFDIFKALSSVAGQTWDPQELHRQFKRIRGENFRELPIEFDVDDLFSMAQREGLVKVEPNGDLTILNRTPRAGAHTLIKARLEHVRRGADRRGPKRTEAGRRKKWVPATKREIHKAINGLKLKNVAVKGILFDITVEANEAYKELVADNERMRKALEKLQALGDLCTTCDAASVREFATEGLGRG